MSSPNPTPTSSTTPWHARLPPPKSSPTTMTVQQLHRLHSDPSLKAGVDYLVVDVRRADMDDPTSNHLIKSAINLPAQTFYQTLPTLLPMLVRIPKIIFHCSSSNGRGPRCAGWYQDALDSSREAGNDESNAGVRAGEGGAEREGKAGSEAFVLVGGLKAWLKEFPGETIGL